MLHVVSQSSWSGDGSCFWVSLSLHRRFYSLFCFQLVLFQGATSIVILGGTANPYKDLKAIQHQFFLGGAKHATRKNVYFAPQNNVTIYQMQLSQPHWLIISRTETPIADHHTHLLGNEFLITLDRHLLFLEVIKTVIWGHSLIERYGDW